MLIPLVDTLSLDELMDARAELEEVIKQRQLAERKEVLKQIRAIAAGVGCTVEDLLDKGKPRREGHGKKPHKPGVPKYYNPNHPSQTWTGKGARPRWFITAQIRGMTQEQLLIQ